MRWIFSAPGALQIEKMKIENSEKERERKREEV
jgi:hypothetical protein